SDVFSIDVASGLVVATEPGAGSRVDKKSTVTVLVSKGPQPHDIPALAGQPLATAQSAFAAATVTLGATAYQFTQNDPDTVLSVAVTPRGAS
ncbi:PASTA domain-containing protein, partial [Acinetobacter baumannii]